MDSSVTFVVDFDGTIAPTDTIDALLDRFAPSTWQAIEEEWIKGHIDSRACMSRQLALVGADQHRLKTFFHTVSIDPGFADFARYVQSFALVAVVSDGLDYPIRHALTKSDLASIPVFANIAEFKVQGLGIDFPHYHAACHVQSGVCKCNVARTLGGQIILIGDGRSDRCLARNADHVFAKNSLRAFCAQEKIRYTAFNDFHDVLAVIREWRENPATTTQSYRNFHGI